jgi:hypothetical protein
LESVLEFLVSQFCHSHPKMSGEKSFDLQNSLFFCVKNFDQKLTRCFVLFSQEVRQAAEFLELPQLIVLLSNTQSNESFMNEETIQHYTLVRWFFYRVDLNLR